MTNKMDVATASKLKKIGDYNVQQVIGEGSFGVVFKVTKTGSSEVLALKLDVPGKKPMPQTVYWESTLNRILFANASPVGFPRFRTTGTLGPGGCQFAVMDLLGKTLQELLVECGGTFSLPTIQKIGQQLLDRFKHMHNKRIVYVDLKPQNIAIGLGKNAGTMFVFDFGCTQTFKADGMPGARFLGTPRFSSLNIHKGEVVSFRDDLEALGYMLCYFFHGELPWQGKVHVDKKLIWKKLGDIKEATPLDELCRDMPAGFKQFIADVRKLSRSGPIDYKHFSDLIGHSPSSTKFDWEIGGTKSSKSTSSKRKSSNAAAKEPKKVKDSIISTNQTAMPSTEVLRSNLELGESGIFAPAPKRTKTRTKSTTTTTTTSRSKAKSSSKDSVPSSPRRHTMRTRSMPKK